MMASDPWVVFEVGLYLDHTKTIEVIHYSESLIITDMTSSKIFSDNAEKFTDEKTLQNKLTKWVATLNS